MIRFHRKSAGSGKVIRLPDNSAGAPVHRYRTPRAWNVAGLAAMAATGTVMLTGAVSATLSDVQQHAQACAVQAASTGPSVHGGIGASPDEAAARRACAAIPGAGSQ